MDGESWAGWDLLHVRTEEGNLRTSNPLGRSERLESVGNETSTAGLLERGDP